MALGRIAGKAAGVLSSNATKGMKSFKAGRHLNTRRGSPGRSRFLSSMRRQRYSFRASSMSKRIDRRV